MKTKHMFWLIIFAFFVVISCEEEEVLIKSFTATQGTRIGNVRLTYKSQSGAEAYEIQRKNPETNTWEQIAYIKSWVPDKMFDDRGGNSGESELILNAGQVYNYRMRAFPYDESASPWSDVISGYFFAPSPRIKKVKYEPNEDSEEPGLFTFTIKDPLPNGISNLINRTITIYRAKATTDGYTQLNLNNYIINGNDSTIYVTCLKDNDDAPYDYKLEISYTYSYTIVNEGGSNLDGGQDNFNYNSLVITEDDIDDIDDGSVETVTYNIINLNEINSSASGGKFGTIMCKDGVNVYLGYFDGWSGFTGKPTLMKNTGSSWEMAGGTLPSDLLGDNSIHKFDFTISGGIIYLAALSSDSLYIYKNDGSWSANMTTPVLLGTTITDEINIAVLNNDLYASIMDVDTLKVFKYQDTGWIQKGGNIAIGFIIDINLKEIDGAIYITYEKAQSGSTESTFYINHLNGSSWVNDLQWTANAASNFDITKSGSNLYFKCTGESSDFLGSVYKVTSTTSVANLFEGTHYLLTPLSITSDASGNIIAAIVNGATIADLQLGVYIYNGSVWKKINDNYNEVSLKSCGVQATNDDIHFVYGLKSSESLLIPEILKAKKYSK